MIHHNAAKLAQGTTPSTDTASPTKPALSPKHLEAWWVFYKAVTAAKDETEDNAIAHVARCFPNHSVKRSRIRELRGKAEKRGPKTDLAE
jgi:hypothetical protein